MNRRKSKELFTRYEGNPILTLDDWPRSYKLNSVFNPGATRINNEVLLLVRVKDRINCSRLDIARSRDGKTNWRIDSKPALKADRKHDETFPGLEDPRIVWCEELNNFIVTYVSFYNDAATVSLVTTKDFSSFERLDRPLISGNKDAALFPKKINGYYALIHRPTVEGRDDIWVSFSPDLKFWGRHRRLLPTRHRRWDSNRVGLGPPPIETEDGWLIIYHGAEDTAAGTIYRIGLALLDLEKLDVIYRSKEWVFGPKETYEMVGDVDSIVFPCGVVVKDRELYVYYGAADTVIALATAYIDDILAYLKKPANRNKALH